MRLEEKLRFDQGVPDGPELATQPAATYARLGRQEPFTLRTPRTRPFHPHRESSRRERHQIQLAAEAIRFRQPVAGRRLLFDLSRPIGMGMGDAAKF